MSGALRFFELNARAHPESANVHDSLGTSTPAPPLRPLVVLHILCGLAAFAAGAAAVALRKGGRGHALAGRTFAVTMIAMAGSGAPRLVRHLWRMCFALFIAVTSLFLGQPQVFPEALRTSGALALPPALVLALLLWWLVRIRLLPRLRLRGA